MLTELVKRIDKHRIITRNQRVLKNYSELMNIITE